MSYEIFADVSIDIDTAFAAAQNVRYVPMEYTLGEESFHCDAPESNEQMHVYYDRLRGKIPTQTSQITPYHYIDIFTPLLKEHKSILYISLSSGLSNTFESAQMAALTLKKDFPDAQIEVVDSLGATGGMGLLTECACENRKNGMSLSENAAWLRSHAPKINYWFMVEDLMYLMRGGRVSGATAVLGTALNIKPVLTINASGKLDTIAKKRGARQAMNYLLSQMESTFDPSVSDVIYICCADCMENAEKLKADVLAKYPDLKVRVTMLSPIIGAHTGPDMLSLIHFGTRRS